MDASAATAQAPAKDPHLPPMFRIGDVIAPKAPQDIAGAQVEEGILTDLAVKLACTTARFTTAVFIVSSLVSVARSFSLAICCSAMATCRACRAESARACWALTWLSMQRVPGRGTLLLWPG